MRILMLILIPLVICMFLDENWMGAKASDLELTGNDKDVIYVLDSECDALSKILMRIAQNRDAGWTFVALGTKWIEANPDVSKTERDWMLNWMYFIFYQVPDKSPEDIANTVIGACTVKWNKS